MLAIPAAAATPATAPAAGSALNTVLSGPFQRLSAIVTFLEVCCRLGRPFLVRLVIIAVRPAIPLIAPARKFAARHSGMMARALALRPVSATPTTPATPARAPPLAVLRCSFCLRLVGNALFFLGTFAFEAPVHIDGAALGPALRLGRAGNLFNR